jgi:hypothetical protein
LRQLRRRLALGQFFDIWPQWAIASLIVAGVVAVAGRTLFPALTAGLPWLWVAPFVMIIPAAAIVASRAFRDSEILALADSLSGGHGALLTLAETGDRAWASVVERISNLPMPRLEPWRRLKWLLPSAVFLAAALAVPQRAPVSSAEGAIAREIAKDLETTLATLKQQELVTPTEEKKLEEEIERIRKGAMDRVDASSWEAADSLREKMAAAVSEKRDALKWAQESLLRYAEAARGGAEPTEAQVDELAKAIQKLAENGMLGELSPELEKLLGGKNALSSGNFNVPADAASREKLMQALADTLANQNGRFGEAARLGREFSHFDPSEFPLENGGLPQDAENGLPGQGGVNRGRGDAELTWGAETQPFDKFKAQALPKGDTRNPDDWNPMVVLSGAPKAAPENGPAAAARDYAAGTGQAAWRRTLAPRHYSAVKNYFEK